MMKSILKHKRILGALVYLLSIVLFGLAGGFTKSETWHYDPCKQYSIKTEKSKWDDCLSDIYWIEENCDTPDEIFIDENNCDPLLAWLNDEMMSYQKVVFDARSTTMFIIASVIIGLVLRLRRINDR
jgi:hypothetical protein